jgi:glucan phosphoethanolaminetransferase (alkaline phosphatase superfamily)
MSKFSELKLFFAQFLPGLITSIAGLSLMVVLFIYRDIIAKDIFPQLTQTQATAVIFSIIGLTFFIAIIGIYAWLATRKDIGIKQVLVFIILILIILSFIIIGLYAWLATREGIQFKHVLVFVILILTILSFLLAAIYTVTKNEKAGQDETNGGLNGDSKPKEPPSPWYFKAMAALESGNQTIALEYVNRGLKKAPQNAPKQVASLLALKIKVLLLIGGEDNRVSARNIAAQNYGYSQALDKWIDCLKQQNWFSSIITTETELETRCPSPRY